MVTAEVISDFPERFAALAGEEVLLESDAGSRTATVAEARASGRKAFLKFQGCESPQQAEAIRGAYVKVSQLQAVSLPEGSYFWHEIVGLQVVDQKGEDLGQITQVLRLPAHDVYITGKVMIPAVKQIVKAIDLAAGRMVVDLPPRQP